MKKLLVLFYIILSFSCSDKKKQPSIFLKDNVIQLAQPQIKASSTIIDSTVIVNAELRMKDASVRFTNNGEMPTEASQLYTTDLKLSKAGKYQFKAFHNDYKPSEVADLELFKKGITPTSIIWETKVNDTYPGLGTNTLINNIKGSLTFRDTQWLGFDTTAVAKVVFKEKQNLEKLTIGFLIDTKSWIFPPERIFVIVNNKDAIEVLVPKLPEGEHKTLGAVVIPIHQNAETIKVMVKNSTLPNWHPGSGNAAWLFMDEWIFN